MDQATDYTRFPSWISYWQANFVNCTSAIPDLANTQVPCLSANNYHVYVKFSDRNLFAYDILNTCKVISMVPTSSENGVNYPYETTSKLLASGFDLRWSVECSDCREADYDTQLGIAITYLVSNSVIDMELVVRYIFLPLVVFAFLLHKCITRKKWLDADNSRPQSESPKELLMPKSMARST
ncbi:hypothetical protein PTKIN_Ptkin17bG0060800 [Pterospermum kingtungense]